MLRRVALVRTDVSVTISSQRSSDATYGYVPSSPILVTLMMEALGSSNLTQPLQVPLLPHSCHMSRPPHSRLVYALKASVGRYS
jgi:hypothetical protein